MTIIKPPVVAFKGTQVENRILINITSPVLIALMVIFVIRNPGQKDTQQRVTKYKQWID